MDRFHRQHFAQPIRIAPDPLQPVIDRAVREVVSFKKTWSLIGDQPGSHILPFDRPTRRDASAQAQRHSIEFAG